MWPMLAVLSPASCLVIGTVWGFPQKSPDTLRVFASAKESDFVDDKVCGSCHSEIAARFPKTYHAAAVGDPKLPVSRRGCQSCHGPGREHVASATDPEKAGQAIIRYGEVRPAEASAACMRCHGSVMHEAQWRRTEHAKRNLSCVSCHTVHGSQETEDGKAPTDLRALYSPTGVVTAKSPEHLKKVEPVLCGECHQSELREFRHAFHHPVGEGRVNCSDCHQVHPTRNSPLKRSFAYRGSCVRCHVEKSGPFRYEHDPVAGWTGDGCTECHRPHGSHNPYLLNSFSRGLCSQCHSDLTATHYPGQTCWASGCHEAVHGSNRDRYLRTR